MLTSKSWFPTFVFIALLPRSHSNSFSVSKRAILKNKIYTGFVKRSRVIFARQKTHCTHFTGIAMFTLLEKYALGFGRKLEQFFLNTEIVKRSSAKQIGCSPLPLCAGPAPPPLRWTRPRPSAPPQSTQNPLFTVCTRNDGFALR